MIHDTICSALIRDKQSDHTMALTHLEISPEIAGLDKHGCENKNELLLDASQSAPGNPEEPR